MSSFSCCFLVSEAAQLCPTLCDPMDCSLPAFSVHGIFQARILEWVVISFSRRYSRPRDWTQISRIVGRRFTIWASRKVLLNLHTNFSGGKWGVWYSFLLKNFPQFIVTHTVKGFGIVNKAKVDVFLEHSYFFDDPTDVGNLISGSSAFSKINLNIWKLMIHVLFKLGLENLEHYFASVWDDCSRAVLTTFFGIAFLGDWNENWPFPVLWPLLSFPDLLPFECSTFTASSFTIWNSSPGIPSPPLALFVVMLPKAHLTSHSRISTLGEWAHHRGYLGHENLFLYSSVYYCYFVLISSASVRSISFLSFTVPIYAWNVPLVYNFLEEISSFSHSVVFLYFFALITEEGFLLSLCYSLDLCIQMGVSFLFSFAFCFSSFLNSL